MATSRENHIHKMNMFKTEIVEDTIRNLLEENDGTFDLSTHEGINAAVDYMVDYLMINQIDENTVNLKEKLIRCLPGSKI